MKVIGYFEPQDSSKNSSLILSELSEPTPGPNDILVRVKAVSVNPVDLKVRKNSKPNNGELKILGWDASGIVEKLGSKVEKFKVGDEVYYAGSINRPGSNSELQLVDERITALKPRKLSYEEAAALPLTTITAYETLFERLNVLVNEPASILIFGGAGGVGSMAIQLAKKLTHLQVIATASRPDSTEWCKKLGADLVVDHNRDIHAQLRSRGIDEVKYIFSVTHTEQHKASMEALIAPQGHICFIDNPETFDVIPFKRKSVGIHLESMFTRSLFETADMQEQGNLLARVADLIDTGKIQTTINHIFEGFTPKNFERAHEMLESEKTVGKIVIKF
ncbi:zinc-binding alcohol dehydrogenase family protein [Bdellovibrio svalbardensis]|uniref:Zinc-type alcohol dehydrogenase-like protein n=1 Tax=Bdellovibrio svalbardensis TaxID=2972972 RepID=A0ABT6DL54_9BACT|nr:zinc-binding alcohol dehydrogenase family protein [Bdellovibrio svalbardensis]MDG0817612.1 zinc-binding alcohol dehydrogenase family protein [Bdellovibrio svalbardensis]